MITRMFNGVIALLLTLTMVVAGTVEVHAAGDTLGAVIPDAALRQCLIASAYGKGFSDATPIEDVANYFSSVACGTSGGYVSDLTGIDRLTKVKSIQLIGHRITDLAPVKNMTQLTKIDVADNQMGDAALNTFSGANLPNLASLYLNNNDLSDISALSSVPSVIDLNIAFNNISDISAIADMKDMLLLNLRYNQVSDLSVLEGMSALYHLYVSNNQVSSLEPLRGTQHLGQVQFANNMISDLSPLEENTNIFNIIANGNGITNLSDTLYDIVKDINYFAYFYDQNATLPKAIVSENRVTVANPVSFNGQFLPLSNISDGGVQSADLATISWDFSATVPQSVSFQFSQALNDVNPNLFSGIVTVPLGQGIVIEFESNGGSTVASQMIESGEKIVKPEDPKKSGYSFEGWYTDAALTQKWDFAQAASADMTLYAHWQAEEQGATANNTSANTDDGQSNLPTTGAGHSKWLLFGTIAVIGGGLLVAFMNKKKTE